MSSKTTRTNTQPATSAPLPSRRQRTEWYPRTNQPTDGDAFPHLAVEQDPERAQKLGEQIQAASRRLEPGRLAVAAAVAEDKAKRANQRAGKQYVRGLNEAKALLQRAAAIKADDTVGEFADYLADQIEREVERASSTVVPEGSDIRPEVPTAAASAPVRHAP